MGCLKLAKYWVWKVLWIVKLWYSVYKFQIQGTIVGFHISFLDRVCTLSSITV